jgi:hypothetical protein
VTYKTTDIVAAFNAEEQAGTALEDLRAVIERKFPGITTEECLHALEVIRCESDARHAEAEAEYRRSKKETEEGWHIFEGLGEAITLSEAIEIKAAQGDPIALRWQAGMNTRWYRLNDALSVAAHEAHPQFEEAPDQVWHWKGDGKMPSVEELIDWFQMTHPTEARRIEAEIE